MINTIIKKYLEELGKDENQSQCGEMYNIIENYIYFKFRRKYQLIYSTQLKQHFVLLIDDDEEEDNVYTTRYFYDEIILKDDEYFQEIFEENFNELLKSMIQDNLITLNFEY